jgi:hypothetical protein
MYWYCDSLSGRAEQNIRRKWTETGHLVDLYTSQSPLQKREVHHLVGSYKRLERAELSVQKGRIIDKLLFLKSVAAAFQFARGFDLQGNDLQPYAFGQETHGCPFPANQLLQRCRSIALLSSLFQNEYPKNNLRREDRCTCIVDFKANSPERETALLLEVVH